MSITPKILKIISTFKERLSDQTNINFPEANRCHNQLKEFFDHYRIKSKEFKPTWLVFLFFSFSYFSLSNKILDIAEKNIKYRLQKNP